MIYAAFLSAITLLAFFPVDYLLAESTKRITVNIGIQLPLSGDLSFVGLDIQRGVNLALDDLKDSPVRINLYYEDDRATPTQAASAAQRLLAQRHVDVIVSLWDMAEIVAPIAERHQTPHISIRWNPHVAERYPHTFTLESTYKTFAKFQLELARKSGAKTLGLITEESTGWILVRDFIANNAGEYGLKITANENYVPTPGLDLRPIVTKVLSKNSDFLIINNFTPWIAPTIRLMKQLKPEQKFTGYFEGIEAPELVEGIPFVNQSNVSESFQNRFLEKYGERYKMRAPHAYDIIRLIHDGYAKDPTRNISHEELINHFNRVQKYLGQSGILTTNSTRNIETEPVLQVYKNGAVTPYSYAK
jgi:ABC-type branched-subunit amino acid transport system substrate-binding protein